MAEEHRSRRKEAAITGGTIGALYGGGLGAGGGLLKGKPLRGAGKGALQGVALGAGVGAAAYKGKTERFGGHTYETNRTPAAVTVTPKGSILPIPSLGTSTNVYRGNEHIGYVDSQRSILKPKQSHVVNAYVDRKHRGQRIGTRATRFNLDTGGGKPSYSKYRTHAGDRLITGLGGRSAPVDAERTKRITGNMDARWDEWAKENKVAKSYVGGGKFVSASKLGKEGLKSRAAYNPYRKPKRVNTQYPDTHRWPIGPALPHKATYVGGLAPAGQQFRSFQPRSWTKRDWNAGTNLAKAPHVDDIAAKTAYVERSRNTPVTAAQRRARRAVNRNVSKAYVGGGKYVSAAVLGKEGLKANTRAGMYKPRGPSKRERLQVRAARMAPEGQRQLTNMATGPITTKKVRGKTIHRAKVDEPFMPFAGLALQSGGRRGKRMYVSNEFQAQANNMGPLGRKRVETHETAHATPNRSSYRMAQITQSPRRTAREEARADAAAGQYYKGRTAKLSRGLLRGRPKAVNELNRKGTSAYAQSAGNAKLAGAYRQNYRTAGIPSSEGIFRPEGMRAYRQVQDRITAAQGRTRGTGKRREIGKAYDPHQRRGKGGRWTADPSTRRERHAELAGKTNAAWTTGAAAGFGGLIGAGLAQQAGEMNEKVPEFVRRIGARQLRTGLISAALAGGAAAAAHKTTFANKDGVEYETKRQLQPVSTTKNRNIPYLMPSVGSMTNAYRDDRHVGMAVAERNLRHPRTRMMNHSYVDAPERSKQTERHAIEAALESIPAGKRTVFHHNRTSAQDKLYEELGAQRTNPTPKKSKKRRQAQDMSFNMMRANRPWYGLRDDEVTKWDKGQKRDKKGRFASAVGTAKDEVKEFALEHPSEAMLLGLGGAVGARYGGRIASGAAAAARYKDPARAARAAAKWEGDVGANVNDMMLPIMGAIERRSLKFSPEERKVILRHLRQQYRPTVGPTERASFRYAKTMEGKDRYLRDAELMDRKGIRPTRALRVLTPSWHENKAFKRMVAAAAPNPQPLYRGMRVTPEQFESYVAGAKLPTRPQSWSTDRSIAEMFSGGVGTGRVTNTKKPHSIIWEAEPGSMKALNISSRSKMSQSEWLSEQPIEIVSRNGNEMVVRIAKRDIQEMKDRYYQGKLKVYQSRKGITVKRPRPGEKVREEERAFRKPAMIGMSAGGALIGAGVGATDPFDKPRKRAVKGAIGAVAGGAAGAGLGAGTARYMVDRHNTTYYPRNDDKAARKALPKGAWRGKNLANDYNVNTRTLTRQEYKERRLKAQAKSTGKAVGAMATGNMGGLNALNAKVDVPKVEAHLTPKRRQVSKAMGIVRPLRPPAVGKSPKMMLTPKAPTMPGIKPVKPKKPPGVKLPQLPRPPRPGY